MEQEQQTQPTHAVPATPKTGSPLAIPIAILIGFAMIAGSIIYIGGSSGLTNTQPATNTADKQPSDDLLGPTGDVRPVDATDNIRGNPNAPIMIVEYSDYDCPFCKRFHEDTMMPIIEKYGASGQVAWVYRHFPIEQLHPNAPQIAAAAECVAELGGNEAFWTFSDLIFGDRSTNQPTNVAALPEYAVTAGIDAAAYEECVESGRTRDNVTADFQDAVNAGAQGTPYSLVLVGGQRAEINGAQSFQVVDSMIQTILSQIEAEG